MVTAPTEKGEKMAEFISCRNCDSPYCKGCNIHTLATMLKAGKFDCLMNEDRSVNRFADVAPVVHGEWVLKERAHYFKCSLCKEPIPYKFGYANSRRYYNFCPNCGAKMDGERKGDDA